MVNNCSLSRPMARTSTCRMSKTSSALVLAVLMMPLLPTRNRKGFDLNCPSYRIEDWISCYKGGLPLLDVGCGLGTNALEALRQGCRVIALDCSEEHLRIARERAGPRFVAEGMLETIFGELPHKAHMPAESVSGLLCAQVMHFLGPEAVLESLAKFYDWLVPGGKLVVLTCSHYSGFNLMSGAIRKVEEKIRREGQENIRSWPGFCNDPTVNEAVESWRRSAAPEQLAALPARGECFQTFSEKQLAALARHVGFEVTEAELCCGKLSNYPTWISADARSVDDDLQALVGKNMVALVAIKPAREPHEERKACLPCDT